MNKKSMVVALGMMCGLVSLYGMDRKQAGYSLLGQRESDAQEDGPRDTVIETRALEKLRASKTDADRYNAITNELRHAADLEGDAPDKVRTLVLHHNDHAQHMEALGDDLYYGKTITTLPLLMRLFERTNKVRLVYDVLTGIVVVVNGVTLGVAIYDSNHASNGTSHYSIVQVGQGMMFLLSVIPFGASVYDHYKQYWIMRPKQESVGY